MDDDADAKMILTAPSPDNWKRPSGYRRITMAGSAFGQSERLQPHIEQSSRPGPEPSSVDADVYIWHYALLVVHAKKEEEVSSCTSSHTEIDELGSAIRCRLNGASLKPSVLSRCVDIPSLVRASVGTSPGQPGARSAAAGGSSAQRSRAAAHDSDAGA